MCNDEDFDELAEELAPCANAMALVSSSADIISRVLVHGICVLIIEPLIILLFDNVILFLGLMTLLMSCVAL